MYGAHSSPYRGMSAITTAASRNASAALDQSPIPQAASRIGTIGNNSQLTEIQMELELLKERRRALEQQRKLLIRGTDSAAAAADQTTSRSNTPGAHNHHHNSTRSSSAISHRSRSRSSRSQSTSAMDQKQFIPSEKERREHLAHNIYLEMKESIRRSWQTDSTLVGGFFQTSDNPKNCTFGRERRFRPLQGQKGPYHLATDVLEMQRVAHEAKNGGRYLTASSRGRPGCNVQSSWNDPKGGCAPGPGAYTPRYQKTSKPSILVSRLS